MTLIISPHTHNTVTIIYAPPRSVRLLGRIRRSRIRKSVIATLGQTSAVCLTKSCVDVPTVEGVICIDDP